MEASEASTLLVRHLGWDYESVPDDVRELADNIVARLECLALAVDLAGAYIGERDDQKAALQRYLVDYDRHRDDLLRRGSFYGLSSYEKTLWTVWDTTLEAIERRFPEVHATLLLAFLSCFNRGCIQDELFRLASHGLPAAAEMMCTPESEFPTWMKACLVLDTDTWDDFHYRASLDPLIRYRLLQRVEGKWPGVAMHGLVQWRAGNYHTDQPRDRWYLVFIAAICSQMLRESDRPQFRRNIIAHIPVISDFSLRCSRVINDDENDQRAEEVRIACGWSVIALIYHDEGRWREAEELELQVMETMKRVLGEEHPDTLISMGNLAATYRNQGRWKEAEELEMQVMKMRKRILGEEHPHTLISIGNLASIYQNQGQWKKAEKLQMQVMKIRKRVLGEEHPHTLIIISNLASTYKNQKRWKEAEELKMQVIKIRKRVLGEEHPTR